MAQARSDLWPLIERQDRVSSSFRGRISRGAAASNDRVTVTIDSIGDDIAYGPCAWNSRGDAIPNKGDHALIVFDDFNEPWVVCWWPA